MNIEKRYATEGVVMNSSCFIDEQGFYNCLVQGETVANDKTTGYLIWIAADSQQRQSVELDFILSADVQQAKREAESIIQSLSITPLAKPLPRCLNTVDWF